MNVKSIVVEQLDWNSTSKSLTIEPDHREQLWVAFPTDYESPRTGPFYFQDPEYENRFNNGFAKCQARQLAANNFFENNGLFTYKTSWYNIPTERNSLSYYALYLPEYAIPTEINLIDPYNKERQYRRTVFKDKQQPRYIIYLQCASKHGAFSFVVDCKFEKDENNFDASSYVDEFQQDFYAQPEEWKHMLNQTEREKTQNFFADQIILNNGNLNQKIEMKKNNPWISGSFYLFLAIVVIAGLSVVSKVVPWTILPFVIIGGILLIGVIGAFQLKNDDKLSESNFIKLMQETYRRLPLLKSLNNNAKDKE